MAGRIRGITIKLYHNVEIGRDAFNAPISNDAYEEVENVLVAPVSSTEVLETLELTGKKAVYQLAIPKGDTHDWEDKTVEFFGKTWRTIGFPTEGIEDMIPLSWNRKVQVERYE